MESILNCLNQVKGNVSYPFHVCVVLEIDQLNFLGAGDWKKAPGLAAVGATYILE